MHRSCKPALNNCLGFSKYILLNKAIASPFVYGSPARSHRTLIVLPRLYIKRNNYLYPINSCQKCYFSSKKKKEAELQETKDETEAAVLVEEDEANDVDKSETSDGSIDIQVKSILDSTAKVIFDFMNDTKSDKQKLGRQAQSGKIRKKPIPINRKEGEDNETSSTSTKETKDGDEGNTGDDNMLPTKFTLPILHFSPSKRVHALPALGLYRKPAFPGFYQVLQIQDQSVLQCLSSVKQSSGHDYIGGFLTKHDKSSEFNGHSLPVLRDDAGYVASYEELHMVGTLLQIITITPNLSFQGGQVILMPHKRIKMTGIHAEPSDNYPLYRVAVEYVEDTKQFEDSNVTKALHLEIITTVKELIKTSHFYKEHFDQIIRFYNLDYPTRLADLIAGISLAKRDQLQNILAEMNIDKRLTMVLEIAKNDLEFAKVQTEVNSQLEEKLSKDQRKYILTEQMKMIKKELGLDSDDKTAVIEALERDFASAMQYMPDEAKTTFTSGISRLKQLESSSAEFGVCRSHLEWLVGLPWGKMTVESTDIHNAKNVLDSHHFGLTDVKTRLLEFMATSILKGNSSGKIICLIGPPGVGKTSIATAMAESLNRKLYRFSLGGLFDVAEIKGHRRTYVGSLPGKFVQALKYTNAMNPLIVLDEIDKLGRDTRGDPASALLEALDPSQNSNFRDYYLDVPIDLSQVLFICTANTSDTIPIPLLDRMELITIPGYLPEEKMLISRNFLIPQTQLNTGLNEDIIHLDNSAIDAIIKQYSREAGVRNLLKCIEKIYRKVALDVVMKANSDAAKTINMQVQTDKDVPQPTENPPLHHTGVQKDEKDNSGVSGNTNLKERTDGQHNVDTTSSSAILSSVKEKTLVTSENLQMYLGVPIFNKETLHPYPLPYGVVMGLAWTNAGGATMYVEAHGQIVDINGHLIEPNRSQKPEDDLKADSSKKFGAFHGSLKVTGHLGTVMTESSQIALTYCKTFIRKYQPYNIFLDEAHIHIHVPEGATPKDGPSGGITMASALISIAGKKRIKPSLAMTGELTISGKVLRVGGIKEKLIAAIREDVHTVLLPKGNMSDIDELDESIKSKLNIIFVDSFDDVYNAAFEHQPNGE